MATSRKFDVTYTLRFTGRSRGQEKEPTFMEEFIDSVIKCFIQVLNSQHPNVKTEVKSKSAPRGV